MKHLLLAALLVGLAVYSYLTYFRPPGGPSRPAQQVQQVRQTLAQAHVGPQGPDARADAAARGVPAARSPAAPAATANPAAQSDIDGALRAKHLTTIMPGQPGLVIIDKQEYSEGEDLPLPAGRKARIVAVQDDGVRLTCEGMTFHLDAPAGPDLAALRRKK